MKRRIGLLLASAVLATVGMFGVSPAEANTGVCAGTGTAALSVGFGLPGNWRTANFSASLTVGTCSDGKGLSATGTVNGACGSSSGYGTTSSGHDFAFVSQGGTLDVTGELTGQFTVAADVTAGGSCATKTAVRFILNGEVVKTHATDCTIRIASTVKPGYNIYVCD